MSERLYVIDSDVFIQAKNRHYAFEICPGFWDNLLWNQGCGRLISIDKVKKELLDGKDDLASWVKEQVPDGLFKTTNDDDVFAAYRDMVKWVTDNDQFKPAAKAEFAETDRADAWLLAYAKAYGLVLVTHEEYAPEAKKRVPIPNVAVAFKVDYCSPFAMLHDLEAAFVWTPPALAAAEAV